MAFVVAGVSLLAVVLVLALAREVRLRRALQQLLSRFLNYWRRRHDETTPLLRSAAALVILTLAAGCGDPPDKRLLDLAQQSLAQQARQSEQLAQQSHQVTEAARQLVTADAQARQELVAGLTQLQQQIQTQRAEFDRQRDALEQERRELAAQRGRDPIVAQAIGAIGVMMACLLPLLLAGYVLFTVNRTSPDADVQAVSEILIGEIVSPAPELLPGPPAPRQLEVKPTERD